MSFMRWNFVRRLLIAFIALTLATVWSPAARAHNPGIFAFLTYDPVQGLTVRLGDVYGAPIEGGRLIAKVETPGSSRFRTLRLKEGPAGTYTGLLEKGTSGTVQITVDATVFEELFRAVIRIGTEEPKPETILPMIEIGAAPKGFDWNWVLYPAAVLLLIVTTVVAIRRTQREGGADVA